jgi:hypothetical protein
MAFSMKRTLSPATSLLGGHLLAQSFTMIKWDFLSAHLGGKKERGWLLLYESGMVRMARKDSWAPASYGPHQG